MTTGNNVPGTKKDDIYCDAEIWLEFLFNDAKMCNVWQREYINIIYEVGDHKGSRNWIQCWTVP